MIEPGARPSNGRASGIVLMVATASLLLGASAARAQDESPRAGGHLAAFRSERDLRAFLRRLVAVNNPPAKAFDGTAVPLPAPPPPPPPPPMMSPNAAVADSKVVVTGSRIAPAPSGYAPGNRKITNTQEADVDEGGIVKAIGDRLVVLRRGRIFSIDTSGGHLRVIDHIDASPPGVSGSADWYDEMLVKGDRIVVVGYSYGRGGTEVNRFRMSADGHLRFEDAYHLRSNDYYSSRNYASRLVGNRLVYYTPLDLDTDSSSLDDFPGVRRWTGDAKAPFTPIGTARRTYIVPQMRDHPDTSLDTLHSVINCDLLAATLKCDATAVIGPGSRMFYVSGSAVYLWVSDAWSDRAWMRGGVRSFVYRLPLDPAEEPSAVAARGAPTDQFSFREDRQNGLLDVLIRSDGGSDAMWRPEAGVGDVALLSIPFASFASGRDEVALDRYRPLPSPGRDDWNIKNRFVGNYVLYGNDEETTDPATLVAAQLRGGPVSILPLPHAISRIDQLGADAVAIGEDPTNALNFSAIDLARGGASVQDRFVFPAAGEGESRSQGFFYRADNADGSTGILGLPVSKRVDSRFRRLFGSAAAILFVRRDQRRMSLAGELGANPATAVDDRCKASCVDWYGNARPIFWDKDRVFALLGYEVVQGRVDGGQVRETERLNFAPGGR